jgi:hypothetical protein
MKHSSDRASLKGRMTDDALFALTFGSVLLAVTGLVAYFMTLRFRRREMQHREWMAAIEKGVPLPVLNGLETSMGGSRAYLLKGLVWLACGVTLMLFLSVWTSTGQPPPLETKVREAQALRELGYTDQQIRGLVAPDQRARPIFPIGLSLIGLVPAGIGVAYLVFYRSEQRRARKGVGDEK